jgi:hypothetical protein
MRWTRASFQSTILPSIQILSASSMFALITS